MCRIDHTYLPRKEDTLIGAYMMVLLIEFMFCRLSQIFFKNEMAATGKNFRINCRTGPVDSPENIHALSWSKFAMVWPIVTQK